MPQGRPIMPGVGPMRRPTGVIPMGDIGRCITAGYDYAAAYPSACTCGTAAYGVTYDWGYPGAAYAASPGYSSYPYYNQPGSFGVGFGADYAAVGVARRVWRGADYCWYDNGWRGPGWYQCGYEFRVGFGWGGPWGWHGWRVARGDEFRGGIQTSREGIRGRESVGIRERTEFRGRKNAEFRSGVNVRNRENAQVQTGANVRGQGTVGVGNRGGGAETTANVRGRTNVGRGERGRQ
jgi:hypothetical protein